MSEWKVEVVKLGKIVKHPNADKLQITNVFGSVDDGTGYPCISQLGSFREGDLAIYVPVDSLVDTRKEVFSFLKSSKNDETNYQARIRAVKLRGIFSMGLLVPLSAIGEHAYTVIPGDDVSLELGVTKYEPDESNRRVITGRTGTVGLKESCSWRKEYTDIDGLRRWSNVFDLGEEVVLTSKIHGSNASYCHDGDRLWTFSQHQTKRPPHEVTEEEMSEYEKAVAKYNRFMPWYKVRHCISHLAYKMGLDVVTWNVPAPPMRPMNVKEDNWWRAARNLNLVEKLGRPGMHNLIVFGEIYGANIQDLKYGSPNEVQFRAFDIYDKTKEKYLDFDDFMELMNASDIPTVPVIYRGPWKPDLKDLAEMDDPIGGSGHIMEGWVARIPKETEGKRRIVKYISQRYLLR